ncbi:hypothetical protein LTR28_013196, partial [Elasticomyces elasticus]
LASALRYLHEDVRIVHRDIKLENCLIDTTEPAFESEGGRLRLCDFGLAEFIQNDIRDDDDDEDDDGLEMRDGSPLPEAVAARVTGTLEYCAPELLPRAGAPRHEPPGDIWAFGVCAYALLVGSLPFSHALPFKVVEMIRAGAWPEDVLRAALAGEEGAVVEAVVRLVKGCLCVEVRERWDVRDVLAAEWFEGLEDVEEEDGGGWGV